MSAPAGHDAAERMLSQKSPQSKSLEAWLARTFEIGTGARLIPMEGLRGLAVLLVFIHHYTTQALLLFALEGWPRQLTVAAQHHGNEGVELFFILSGFLIYGMLITKRPKFLRFMARRVVRIYPAFLVAFALAVVLDFAKSSDAVIPREALAGSFTVLINALLIPGVFPLQPILVVAWTLSFEMFFYLTCAAVILGLRLYLWPRRSRVAAICIAAMLLFAARAYQLIDIPIRMLPFFAGMILFEAHDAKTHAVPPVLAILVALGAIMAGQIDSLVDSLGPVPREILLTLPYAALCLICFQGDNFVARMFSWTPLRWLGNMSYSYYLMHGFAVTAITMAIAKILGPSIPGAGFWPLMAASFVLSLIPSVALFVCVERPISLRPHRAPRTLRQVGIPI